MKIAILGADGMLGTDLLSLARQKKIETATLFYPAVDIRNAASLERAISPCDWLINCSAFTRVDDAEKERDETYAVNATGAENLAKVCAAKNVKLLHISTDYVFNGKKGTPYVETDSTNPLNYYGVSKLEGEKKIQAIGGHTLIVRTQSLYGIHGRNFVKAILKKINEGQKTLRVVNDQVSSPTYTRHLAEAIFYLLPLNKKGLVHVANAGFCSWFDFAKAIVTAAGADVQMEKITTRELNLPALRPAFSVLDTSLYQSWTSQKMPTWQEGLSEYLREEPTFAAR